MSCFFKLCAFASLSAYPELPNGHAEIVADGSHHIAGDVCLTTLNSSEVVGTIAKECSKRSLGKLLNCTFVGHGLPKHPIRCLRYPLDICTDGFWDQVIMLQ